MTVQAAWKKIFGKESCINMECPFFSTRREPDCKCAGGSHTFWNVNGPAGRKLRDALT